MTTLNAEDIYSVIGFALVYIQSVERNMKFCTTFVLGGDAELTWDALQNIEKTERKKTLGYFIGKVRERASIYSAFDETLDSFLQDRNDFVHNVDKIPGWNLDSSEGIALARGFVMSLLRRAHLINEIFASLMTQWQQQANIHAPTTPEIQAYLDDIEIRYGHLVNVIFSAPET